MVQLRLCQDFRTGNQIKYENHICHKNKLMEAGFRRLASELDSLASLTHQDPHLLLPEEPGEQGRDGQAHFTGESRGSSGRRSAGQSVREQLLRSREQTGSRPGAGGEEPGRAQLLLGATSRPTRKKWRHGFEKTLLIYKCSGCVHGHWKLCTLKNERIDSTTFTQSIHFPGKVI